MRDYNFFSSLLEGKGTEKKKSLLMVALVMSLSIVAVAFVLLFGAQFLLRMNIESSKDYLATNSPKDLEMSIIRQKIELIKKYTAYLDRVTIDIGTVDILDKTLLDKLNGAMPKSTYLYSAAITNKEIRMVAVSNDKAKAAELVHNMQALDLFKTVNLESVTIEKAETTSNNITVLCIFKDVVTK